MTQPDSGVNLSEPSHGHDPKQTRRLTILALAFLAVVIGTARVHTFNEPFERDITLYAVVAHEMLAGRDLYSDLWEHKPPAVFLTYAAAELVGGYGPSSIYLLVVAGAVVTMIGLYRVTRELGAGVFGGLCAATYWAVLSGDLHLEANQPNTEVFLNASLVWALAFVAQARERPAGRWRWMWIGALFAWASLYKQVVLVIPVLLVGAHCFFPPPQTSRRQALVQAGLIGCVIAAAWGAVMAYFAVVGRFGAFWETVITFNSFYAGNMSGNLILSLRPGKLFPESMRPLWPFVAFAGMGLVAVIVKAPARVWMLLLAYVVGAQITVALPGHFFAHYYQLWLPPLILVAAMALDEVWELRRRFVPWLAPVLAVVLIGFLLSREIPLYRLTAEEWSEQKYRGGFEATKRMGLALPAMLEPGETFYTWGDETGLYFYSQQSPPSGLIHNYGALEGPLVDKLVTRLLADLSARPPDLFIIERNLLSPAEKGLNLWMDPRVFEWFSAHYNPQPVVATESHFILHPRRGSKLEARMKANAGQLTAE